MRRGSHASASALTLIGFLVGAGFTLISQLVVARLLGPAAYGVFALALGLMGVLLLPADFGLSAAATRFMAEREGDREGVGAILRQAIVAKVFLAGIVSLALFVGAGWIAAAYGIPELAWPLRLSAVAMFGQTLMILLRATLITLNRPGRALVLVTSESALETAAMVALVLIGGGAAGAAGGRMIGLCAGAVIGLSLTAAWWAHRRSGRAQGVAWKTFFTYAGAMLIVDGAFALFHSIDLLIAGALLTSTDVGVLEVALRWLMGAGYPVLALSMTGAPRLVTMADDEQAQSVNRMGALVLGYGIVTAPILALGVAPLLPLLLGSGFAMSATLLAAMAPYFIMTTIAVFFSLVANYLGIGAGRIPIALAALALNALLDILLMPSLGIMAAVISTTIAYGLYTAGHVWLVRRRVAVSLHGQWQDLGRCVIAAAVLSVGLAAFWWSGILPLGIVVLVGAVAVAARLVLRPLRTAITTLT